MSENNSTCCGMEKGDCGCVGYAYVPIQILGSTYDVSTALTQGTIFPELNLTINEYGKVCHETGGIV